jgi:hypothetical protein
MGRHSAADDDGDEGGAGVRTAAPAAPRPRARHSRTEDAETTGPVDPAARPTTAPVPVRPADLQDEHPTQRLDLSRITERPAPPAPRPARAPTAAPPASSPATSPATSRAAAGAAATSSAAPPAEGTVETGREPVGTPDEAVETTGAPGQATSSAQDAAGSPAPPGRGDHATADDLALLRRRADVRNRCIAAVVAPFVLYVVVMVLTGATGPQYLIWSWIPLVTAGVLAGSILDAAHRKSPPHEPPR